MPEPSREEILDIISKTPKFEKQTSDTIPQGQEGKELDLERLGKYLLAELRKDLKAREDFGWNEKLAYDVKAYYGVKDEYLSQYPWPRSSNFPQPITPALLDTAHSNLLDAQFQNQYKLTDVQGVGPEDVKSAENLSKLLNSQMLIEMDMRTVLDEIDFDTLLHGTGILKVIGKFNESEFEISPKAVNIQNIVTRIKASGFRVEDTDLVTQFIPLTLNEKMQRSKMEFNGKKVYEGIEDLPPGFKIGGILSYEEMRMISDQIAGVDTETYQRNELYYLAESYVSYYPKDSSRLVELVVWWSPYTGKIFRHIVNEDKVRPYSRYWLYEMRDYFYKMSLPQKIRHIQEKSDYTDKQVTDAADKAISPAGFYEEGTNFDPDLAMRVPGGMYPVKNAGDITWEQPNITAIIERSRHLDELWNLAERLTGLTDLFQGREPMRAATLGEATLRTNRSEIRFNTLFERMNIGWSETMAQIYYYDDKYMPRDKKVKILGTRDFQSIDEFFPHENQSRFGLGLTGKYDFNFSGKPKFEIEQYKSNVIAFCREAVLDPSIAKDEGNIYRLRKKQAEAMGIEDFESLVLRPPSANIFSVEEAIQKAMSGQKEIVPDLSIDGQYWSTRIQLYMRGEGYERAPEEYKQSLRKLLVRVEAIRKGQLQAQQDVALIRARQNTVTGITPPVQTVAQGQNPIPQVGGR